MYRPACHHNLFLEMELEFRSDGSPSIYRAVASSSVSCPMAAEGRIHQSLDLQEARDQTRWWSRIESIGPWYLAAPQMAFFICESKTQTLKTLDILEQAYNPENTRFSVEVFLYISVYEPLTDSTIAGILQSDSRIFAEGNEVREKMNFLRRLSQPKAERDPDAESFEELGISRWVDGYLAQRFLPARILDREIGALRITVQPMNADQSEQQEGSEHAEVAEAYA